MVNEPIGRFASAEVVIPRDTFKSSNAVSKNWFGGLLVTLLGLFSISAAHAQIFVTNETTGTIGEYNLDGSTVNASLITGLSDPSGIVVSGSDIFVGAANGKIGEYTTSGTTVNASLVSGLGGASPDEIAVLGSDLFVVNFTTRAISEYTTSGATVNTSLVTGLNGPFGIVVVAVPEPSTWALLLGGLGLLAFWRLRTRRA